MSHALPCCRCHNALGYQLYMVRAAAPITCTGHMKLTDAQTELIAFAIRHMQLLDLKAGESVHHDAVVTE